MNPSVVSRAEPAAVETRAAARCRVEAADPAQWDALVRELPEHTVFHELSWLRSLAAAHDLGLVLLRATHDGECLGAWPLLTRKKGPLRVTGSPFPGLGTPYMGPLIAMHADVTAVVRAFLGHETLRRSSWIGCRVLDRTRAVDLGHSGFSPLRAYETSWLDLRDPEAVLWRNLKSECRTRIRRAGKLGVEVHREENAAFLEEFWAMTLETFARSGSQPTHTRKLAEEVWERLQPAGRLLVLSAFQGDARLATVMLPHDDDVLYYWAGASFDRYRAIPAGNLLQWQAIVEAKRLGLRAYDMISSNGGSGRFKKSFGASTVRVATHWERCASPAIAVLRRAYEWWLLRRRHRISSGPEAAHDA